MASCFKIHHIHLLENVFPFALLSQVPLHIFSNQVLGMSRFSHFLLFFLVHGMFRFLASSLPSLPCFSIAALFFNAFSFALEQRIANHCLSSIASTSRTCLRVKFSFGRVRYQLPSDACYRKTYPRSQLQKQSDGMFTGYFSESRHEWVYSYAAVLCGSPGSASGRILEEESSHRPCMPGCFLNVWKHLKILYCNVKLLYFINALNPSIVDSDG